MAMIIRRAAATEVDEIRDCVAASLNATYGGVWTKAPLPADDEDWASAWVACASDRIVGVGLSTEEVVSDLWVHPAAQGRGAGTALLAAMEEEIAGRGYSAARLRCLEINRKARSFYAARGWIEVRTYPHERIPMNTVDMAKLLVARHAGPA
jgi:GNAT superfamily N-acetyltransferase